ncbi:hypothetical protein SDC9_43596 [bioreactor metagenome]|uniref:FlgN protein n=1 Tax=bioreactor metagenome TaxID=1076179 RepID=A0A644W0Z1_9ZZZZ
MNSNERSQAQLLSYMNEVLNVCVMLKEYTQYNQNIFIGNDDKEILKVINKRESYIDKLVSLEYKIDTIFEEVDEYEYGDVLPHDSELIFSNIRNILKTVMDLDMKAMENIGFKMQKYKDETLKARNKKHLSAYVKTNLVSHSVSNYDFKK